MPVLGGAGDRAPEGLGGDRLLPHLVQLTRRPRKHHHGGPRPGLRRDDEPGRGADRIKHGRADRHHRLLAVGLADGVLVQPRPAAHQRPQDLGDALLQIGVEHHLSPGEAAHDLGREIVRRRSEPAARDDQGHPGIRHEPQRAHEVLGPVADDVDHGRIHPVLDEALGQPGAVAVGDDPGQDLGAGDQDPGPHGSRRRANRAHAQVGRWAAASGVVLPGVSAYPTGAPGPTVTFLPLTFICTALLPSVTSSFFAVSVGTV